MRRSSGRCSGVNDASSVSRQPATPHFSWLIEHDVVACDINPIQLAYAERRAAGGPVEIGDAERAMHLMRVLHAAGGLASAAGSRVPRALRWRRAAGVLEAASRHAAFPHRSRCADVARHAARVYAPPLLSALPARFGGVLRSGWNAGSPGIPTSRIRTRRRCCSGAKNQPLPEPVRTIRFVAGDAASWLESAPASSFDAFTLSNILDGAEPGHTANGCRARCGTRPLEGAVVVLRSFAEPIRQQDRNHAELRSVDAVGSRGRAVRRHVGMMSGDLNRDGGSPTVQAWRGMSLVSSRRGSSCRGCCDARRPRVPRGCRRLSKSSAASG